MAGTDEQTFLDAFRSEQDALFRHAFFRLSDRDRAADLTQDAFMKTWDYIRGGGDIRDMRRFLFRVLNNLIIDEYRRSKTESLDKKLEANPALEAEFAEGSLAEFEEGMDEESLLTKVKDAMEELPDEYKTALTMRFIDGFSPKEIARMIGATENVVSVRIHRGIGKLKNILQTI